jgi:hypothetical protein
MARAGFFYRPAHDSTDNVQCFSCGVKLDGWEETDVALAEHLAHAKYCAWAIAMSVSPGETSGEGSEERDPLGEELYTARQGTFTVGDGWPHESKKGWKCKVNKLVEAGWCWDPSPDGDEPDGVTCFYCNLSLDGWEPKDDPFLEHQRREPECLFFQLLQHYHGEAGPPKKGKRSTKTRSSAASKTSRMSTQSAVTVSSDLPSIEGSLADIPMNSSLAGVDDSILTTGTTTSTAGTKGKKKAGRTKAATKTTKSRSKVAQETEREIGVRFEDSITMHRQESEVTTAESATNEEAPPPKKAPKRTVSGRSSKQTVDSSMEISATEGAPAKKSTRGRKPKAQPEPEPEVNPELEVEPEVPNVPQTPDADAISLQRTSDVSAQLQDELENSVDNFGEELEQSTPIAIAPPKQKRGVKRTSDGLRKQQDSSVIETVQPASEVEPAAKIKRGRKPKNSSTALMEVDQGTSSSIPPDSAPDNLIENHLPTASQDAEADDENSQQPKKARAPAKKIKGKSKVVKKTSSARSSKATTAEPEPESEVIKQEDDEDEREIELELERIASEQTHPPEVAIQAEQDLIHEYEPSPSQGRASKDAAELQQLQEEIDTENQKPPSPTPQRPRPSPRMPGGFTPSPHGSDKENVPSSSFQVVTAQKPAPIVFLSPSKTTTRVPLAAGTPHRSPARVLLSPSKQHISGLRSKTPWSAADLDVVLLPSPQPSPAKVRDQLVAAAGALSSPEKKMSVEEWVRYRARMSEEELRRRCERQVEIFEREGMRALESLSGINMVG